MDTQSLSKQCESIDEYVLRLQRMKEEEEERDREEKVEEEERRRREYKERIFQVKETICTFFYLVKQCSLFSF